MVPLYTYPKKKYIFTNVFAKKSSNELLNVDRKLCGSKKKKKFLFPEDKLAKEL